MNLTSERHGVHCGWGGDVMKTLIPNFQTSSVLDLTKVQYFSMNGGVLVAGSASIEALVFHMNGSNLAVRSYNVADATPFLSAIHRAPPGVVRYNEDIRRPLFSMNTYAAHKPLPDLARV